MRGILLKLIDESIIPSLALVLAKIGGLLLSVVIFNLDLNVNQISNGLIPIALTFGTAEELMISNTLSNSLMLAVSLAGFGYVQYKISYFQDKRISPTKLISLADKDLLKLTESSRNIYAKALVWTIFLWISIILTVISVFLKESYLWIAPVALIAGIFCTLILVKNIEIDYIKSK